MMKRGQIWVETVIYTLIGLALIGVVLAIITPKINQSRDRIIVEQSIASLNAFDDKIKEVIDNGQGNRRIIREFTLKKGDLIIGGPGDEITLLLKDLSKPYSEPGVRIDIGNVIVMSEVQGKNAMVYLILNYSTVINLTFDNKDVLKKFNPATIPYSFTIDNIGGGGSLFVIDIEETTGRGNLPTTPVLSQVDCSVDADCTPDANSCTDTICSNSHCTHVNNNSNSCDDGLYCTATDSCNNGVCIGSIDPCAGQTCNENTNSCENIQLVSACQDLDLPNTVYSLSADLLTTPTDRDCLIVKADNITIEGNNKQIVGLRTPGIDGIYVDHNYLVKNLTIRNLIIRSFDFGINLRKVSKSSLYNNIVSNSISIGISAHDGNNISYKNNQIIDSVHTNPGNLAIGISFTGNTRDQYLENNYICDHEDFSFYCAGPVGVISGSSNTFGEVFTCEINDPLQHPCPA